MNSKDQLIEKLRKENEALREENNYYKSPLFQLEICDVIKSEYSILLNPPLRYFKTTKNQKSSLFEIDVNDIICILSEGKFKWIYFKEPQSSVDGIRHVSDKLSYTGSISDFLKEFDNQNIHLCQVSRSAIVNVFNYYIDRNKLRLFKKRNKYSICDNITISAEYKEAFKARKKTIANFISFLKIEFRGNYSPFVNSQDNFEA